MSRSSTPTLSVIVPARNEARNLEIVLPQLPPDAEIVLVDGHSVDDTVAVTRRLRPDAVIVSQGRRGKGNALAHGFAAATGDVIVMFDADGSADAAEIPAFVEALVAGADVAKGTRFAHSDDAGSEDITLLRRLGNAGLNGLANAALRTRYSDLCYGYNAFWRDTVVVLDLPALDLDVPAGSMLWGDGFEIETLLTCRFSLAGLRIAEVASTERERIHGETNLRTFADGVRVLRTLGRECVPGRRRAARRRADAMRAAAPSTDGRVVTSLTAADVAVPTAGTRLAA
ncbi:glycosyltransferase family 2 protein [Actinomycetospora atypica]|uniref:Glycosyltransferase family 2 protein n=1 Tax=Actinomycetospora atypica TaxID=1290095 RepID=A0ABV9YRL4_9PSEU